MKLSFLLIVSVNLIILNLIKSEIIQCPGLPMGQFDSSSVTGGCNNDIGPYFCIPNDINGGNIGTCEGEVGKFMARCDVFGNPGEALWNSLADSSPKTCTDHVGICAAGNGYCSNGEGTCVLTRERLELLMRIPPCPTLIPGTFSGQCCGVTIAYAPIEGQGTYTCEGESTCLLGDEANNCAGGFVRCAGLATGLQLTQGAFCMGQGRCLNTQGGFLGGDPHYQSMDGSWFDHHANGHYLLASSSLATTKTNNDFEIQVCTSKPNNLFSLLLGVAIRVGNEKYVYTHNNEIYSPNNSPKLFRVEKLFPGNMLNTIFIGLYDGTRLKVETYPNFLNIRFQASSIATIDGVDGLVSAVNFNPNIDQSVVDTFAQQFDVTNNANDLFAEFGVDCQFALSSNNKKIKSNVDIKAFEADLETCKNLPIDEACCPSNVGLDEQRNCWYDYCATCVSGLDDCSCLNNDFIKTEVNKHGLTADNNNNNGCRPLYSDEICSNNGVCDRSSPNPADWSCICSAGTQGNYCENIDCSYCDNLNRECLLTGKCSECKRGYSSDSSDTTTPCSLVLDCDDNSKAVVQGGNGYHFCLNGGICTDDENTNDGYFTCTCVNGYSGLECEIAPPTPSPTPSPTDAPTDLPTSQPTDLPTSQPSELPTSQPSELPTSQPSELPTSQPSELPTSQPSELPTSQPSELPTSQPSELPTSVPTDLPTPGPTDDNDDCSDRVKSQDCKELCRDTCTSGRNQNKCKRDCYKDCNNRLKQCRRNCCGSNGNCGNSCKLNNCVDECYNNNNADTSSLAAATSSTVSATVITVGAFIVLTSIVAFIIRKRRTQTAATTSV